MTYRKTVARLVEAGLSYFLANPEDDLDTRAFSIKFDCSESSARRALLKLRDEGFTQAIVTRRSKTFPASLSAGELLAVKALLATGTHGEAAKLLGVAVTTARSQIQSACRKAGVNNMVRLTVAYLRAQPGAQP
jgi:DNA-binding GntR family transcriptional regulator